jgi:hypothetical protein
MGTTNILDLNNRLEKVEKNVAPNSYTSLKNKPKINNVTLTGNKSLADIGAAAAADMGELTDLTTTDKSSCVGAINELNSGLTNLNSRVVTSGDTTVQSADFSCRSGYACISVNAFVQNFGCAIFDIVVSGGVVTTKDCMTGEALSSSVATATYNNGVLTVTFNASATYTAIYQTPLS